MIKIIHDHDQPNADSSTQGLQLFLRLGFNETLYAEFRQLLNKAVGVTPGVPLVQGYPALLNEPASPDSEAQTVGGVRSKEVGAVPTATGHLGNTLKEQR